jgi:hypothetical protein
MQMKRRGLILAAAAWSVAGTARAADQPGRPQSGRLAFKAFRNGNPLGSHVLDFTSNGTALTVSIAVDYAVSFGPVTVFRYKLRAVEQWAGDRLEQVRSQVDNDGHAAFMNADRDGDSLLVDGSKSGKYRAPAGAIAASHWNRREVEGPMINPENGELLTFSVAESQSTLPSGAAFGHGLHYALTGPSTIDLWYGGDDIWTALRAVAPDGSIITYETA